MRVGAGSCHADIRWHLVDELADIDGCIKAVTGKVEAYASQHDAVSRLVTIPGIGVLCATAIVAAVGEGRQSREAHDLPAWLVPAEHSTGGRQTLPGISKRGNRYVRRLIIHGARSCFLHLSRADYALGGGLSALEARNCTPLPMPKGDR